jgi:hypothetical protein
MLCHAGKKFPLEQVREAVVEARRISGKAGKVLLEG